MIIKFYTTQSESNCLIKELTETAEIEGVFRDDVNPVEPTLTISTADVSHSNYCHIPALGRFYFVEGFEIEQTGVIRVNLKLDVLMTYQEQIRGLDVIVSASEGNPYYSGRETDHDVRPAVESIEFENNFNESGSIVLVTI